MSTIETVLLSLLVLDAIALTVLVLLQQGKGADVGAAFGSGSSNTMFGSAGGTSFLTKATAWLAIFFFAIAFGLAYVAKERAAAAGSIGIPTPLSSPAETSQGDDSGVDIVEPEGDIPSLDASGIESSAAEAAEAVQQQSDEAAQQAGDAVDAALQELQKEAEKAGDELPGDVPEL